MSYPNTQTTLYLCANFLGAGICVACFLFAIFGASSTALNTVAIMGAILSAAACLIQICTGGDVWTD